MSNVDVAMAYLSCFSAGEIEGLKLLLDAALTFQGSFHTFGSASETIDSLYRDPPERSASRVLSVTEGENSLTLFYESLKSDRPLTIAQLFRFRDGKKADVLLIYEGRGRSGIGLGAGLICY